MAAYAAVPVTVVRKMCQFPRPHLLEPHDACHEAMRRHGAAATTRGNDAIAFARDEKPFAFLTEERLQGCLTAVLAKVSEAWEIGVRRKMKRDVAKSIGHRWSGELGDRDDAAERMRFQSSRPSHESIAKRPGPVS